MTTTISIFGRDAYPGQTEEQRLRREVDELRNRIASMQEKATQVGIVTSVHERDGHRWAIIKAAGATIEKRLVHWSKDVRIGMSAKLLQEGAQPIEYGTAPVGGMVVVVDRAYDGMVEFACQNVQRTATTGLAFKPGERALLDQDGTVVVQNLGALGASAGAQSFGGETGVDWDDIGGLEDVKRALREAIEEPIQHAAVYARFGKRPCKGIMLHGAPGGGKTMCAKACATALAKVHGKAASATGYQYCKGPELLHGLVGSSESNVRQLFANARAHFAAHGYPAVIVLDEADALLSARGHNPWEGIEKTVVPMFLAEMDGLDSAGALVIVLTNRPDSIDPAFLRHGRIDLTLEVPYASQAVAADIFGKQLKGRPIKPKTLPELAAAELWKDKYVLRYEREKFPMSRVVTGSVISGIVERATQVAMRRAIAGEDEGSITLEDIATGIAETAAGKRGKWTATPEAPGEKSRLVLP